MTENKRFEYKNHKVFDNLTGEEHSSNMVSVNVLNQLAEENEQLREALKNSYVNEICENCKYGHYWISGSYGFGLEGEFECTKKHFGNDHWKCDGLTECDDFELDLKGDDGDDD